jgi:cytochrome c6
MAGVPDFDRPGAVLQSDRSLLTRIQAGKRACPAYRGILREQEIFDVIAYIRSLGLSTRKRPLHPRPPSR